MNIVTATTHVISLSNMTIISLSEFIIVLQEGQLGKWKKKAGDSFQRGDCLCDITLDRVIVGVDAKEAGILAKIVVSDYQTAPINSTIALLASDMNEYMDFVANEMADSYDAELQKAVNEVAEAKGKKPDMTVLMRVINHLIKCGSIKQGSGTMLINATPTHIETSLSRLTRSDYAKSLQSLAVKGDDRLMSIFIASSDGSGHDEDSFDEARFIENTSDYINDLNKEKSNL